MDTLMLILLASAGVYGYYKGLLRQGASAVGAVVGVLVCRMGGTPVLSAFTDCSTFGQRVLCYILLFAAVFVLTRVLFAMCSRAMSRMHLRPVDRFGGAAFSMAVCLLAISLLLNAYIAIKPAERAQYDCPDKPWRQAAVHFAPLLMGYLSTSEPQEC